MHIAVIEGIVFRFKAFRSVLRIGIFKLCVEIICVIKVIFANIIFIVLVTSIVMITG
ncbi:hypothetical protein SDC9_156371 [bioreactor metagenome]|uniref:Uncharacterized protein n=1 Tax=bioreactor metagenome TaxID=1076179 RepID=A0A645F9E0_9ZZZZ